jgi:hypothetical protein
MVTPPVLNVRQRQRQLKGQRLGRLSPRNPQLPLLTRMDETDGTEDVMAISLKI